MKHPLTILLATLLVSCLPPETYVVIDKSEFEEFLATKNHSNIPADVLHLYFYDFSGRFPPPMQKVVSSTWEEGDVSYISNTMGVQDESIAEIKVSIGYTAKDSWFDLVEIREAYGCRQGNGHTHFSKEPCQ